MYWVGTDAGIDDKNGYNWTDTPWHFSLPYLILIYQLIFIQIMFRKAILLKLNSKKILKLITLFYNIFIFAYGWH